MVWVSMLDRCRAPSGTHRSLGRAHGGFSGEAGVRDVSRCSASLLARTMSSLQQLASASHVEQEDEGKGWKVVTNDAPTCLPARGMCALCYVP